MEQPIEKTCPKCGKVYLCNVFNFTRCRFDGTSLVAQSSTQDIVEPLEIPECTMDVGFGDSSGIRLSLSMVAQKLNEVIELINQRYK